MSAVPLTPELRQRILSSIRAGGYAHIAAQAWGVSERLWRRWLARGRRAGAAEPYASFYQEVQQARAQARLKAELDALQKDPRFWLKTGPGKDPGEGPCWSMGRAGADRSAAGRAIDLGELKGFLDRLRTLLAAEPAVTQKLDEAGDAFFKAQRSRKMRAR